MQSKGVIKLLAILLAIACIYQLSFSLKARSVEKKAAEYAAKVSESDSLRQAAEIYYLDSVQNRPVYDLGFISFTYKEVKEKEINLGLDLKGGMNVMLEVQVEDVLKALAGDSAHDPMFEEAIARANKALKEGTNNYIGVGLGGAIDLPFSMENRLQVALDFNYLLPSEIRQLQAGIGAEYNFLKYGVVRAGYHFGDKDKGVGNYGTLGCGINFWPIRADFSYALADKDCFMHRTWQLGIGIVF